MRGGKGRAAVPLFNFILQPEFPLNGLILAIDALRIANQNSGKSNFRWSVVSENGRPVRASNGMWFGADCSLQDMPEAEVYLLFEGNLPTQNNSPKMLAALRDAARHGAIVGGVDTGAFALAQAGLVATEKSPEAVLHWEAVPAFVERFPAARPVNRIYLLQDRRAHCAGGVATLDLMLELVAHFKGEPLANEIANALVHTRRDSSAIQRGDGLLDSRDHPLSGRIIRLMEENLDFPLSLSELAASLRIPERTLSHVCRQVFGESPMRLYLRLRLQAARNFLFYEEQSIKAVSIACGFSYPSVFSRVFRRQFGQTPREFRARIRAKQRQNTRPEILRMLSENRGPAGLHRRK
jgi:AraC family carnitine catabolism transcriptional activator